MWLDGRSGWWVNGGCVSDGLMGCEVDRILSDILLMSQPLTPSLALHWCLGFHRRKAPWPWIQKTLGRLCTLPPSLRSLSLV